ncbi:Inositol phosphorylceramide glucuronosyltransferase 1 [Capsicum annuum]|nr:Inositol phosphorylceramide glucuronosyltransferase 1 [Capsicum annuum]
MKDIDGQEDMKLIDCITAVEEKAKPDTGAKIIRSKLLEGGGVDVIEYGPDCTYFIVDRTVYDDLICVATRRDGKVLVTNLWVEHNFDVGMAVDHLSIMYRPMMDLNGIPGAKSLMLCLTAYQWQDRNDIMVMVYLDADTIAVKRIEDLFKCRKFCANLKHFERLNSGVTVVELLEKVFNDMMSKVTTLPSYTGGFLNSYYVGFANAHVYEPNLPSDILNSRKVPEMERLSTLYNADVGLYMLANKVFFFSTSAVAKCFLHSMVHMHSHLSRKEKAKGYSLLLQIMYRPLMDLDEIPGAKSLMLCLTGYQWQDRNDIMRLNSGVMVVEPSEKVFNDMMSKVTTLPSYTGGDQGFLNSYYVGFANAHIYEPNLSSDILNSRKVPEIKRLSTLYNADVGLYMIANKESALLGLSVGGR